MNGIIFLAHFCILYIQIFSSVSSVINFHLTANFYIFFLLIFLFKPFLIVSWCIRGFILFDDFYACNFISFFLFLQQKVKN